MPRALGVESRQGPPSPVGAGENSLGTLSTEAGPVEAGGCGLIWGHGAVSLKLGGGLDGGGGTRVWGEGWASVPQRQPSTGPGEERPGRDVQGGDLAEAHMDPSAPTAGTSRGWRGHLAASRTQRTPLHTQGPPDTEVLCGQACLGDLAGSLVETGF